MERGDAAKIGLQKNVGSCVFHWQLLCGFSEKIDISSAKQLDDDERNEQRMLTAKAVKCRGELRWAQNFSRKRQHSQISELSHPNKILIEELNSGELQKRANDATEKSGHGRIRNSDGTYTDIGGSTQGTTRTILDG